jgi:hypothetical protein
MDRPDSSQQQPTEYSKPFRVEIHMHLLFLVYKKDSFNISEFMTRNYTSLNNGFERMWKEPVVTYLRDYNRTFKDRGEPRKTSVSRSQLDPPTNTKHEC